jgi:Domain of unknown function (DUF4350)
MKLFASLDRKDRTMLSVVLAMVAVLIVLLAVFSRNQDANNSVVPDSYLTGVHGAKAAYTLLEQSGYSVQRWEQHLSNLPGQAASGSTASGSVLIVAEPVSRDPADRKAIAEFLRNGGTVLATGATGGYLLPGSAITSPKGLDFAACNAQPNGLSPLANTGSIWMVPASAWDDNRPEVHTAYTCAGQPVVVEYDIGKGHVVWWASSTPLENGSIERDQNLDLLLNSIGEPTTNSGKLRTIYWDESLHGQVHAKFQNTLGPIWNLLWSGALGVALLVILSFSRRSGPVRPLPQIPRTTPIEFLDALGGLYRSTGANSTAVQIAWERFRAQAGLLTGQKLTKKDTDWSASEVAAAITRRYGSSAAGMEPDLVAAEEAITDYNLKPRRALAIVQALRRHEETLRNASSRGRTQSPQEASPAS